MVSSMPSIEINFKKAAQTMAKRSARGVLCVILRDTVSESINVSVIGNVPEGLSEANAGVLESVFCNMPKKVYLVLASPEAEFKDIEQELDKIVFNWIAAAELADQSELVKYVKNKNKEIKSRKIKAVVYNQTSPDDFHIVNFVNPEIVVTDTYPKLTAEKYTLRIAAFLAGLPITEGATYKVFSDLVRVSEPENKENALELGGFFFFNDDGDVRVARAINSKTKLEDTQTEDMKKISVTEVMDLIIADIAKEFKDNFCGKYRNSSDNQALFVSAVNTYFEELANEGILDSDFSNKAEIDIENHRQALIEFGKDAEDWSDSEIKKNTVQDKVFLTGNIRILDCVEDLVFEITMN